MTDPKQEKPPSYNRPLGTKEHEIADRVAELIFALRMMARADESEEIIESSLSDAFALGERFARELRLRKQTRGSGARSGASSRPIKIG